MLYTIIHHLKALNEDLGHGYVDEIHRPLLAAGRECIVEVVTALETHNLNRDAARLNRELISAAMDFNQRWENWLSNLPYGRFRHPSSRVFHEFLLRFSKGSVKYWRIWRIDISKHDASA